MGKILVFITLIKETYDKKITKTLIFFTLLIVVACGQKDSNKLFDEGNVKNEIYTSKEIGWTLEISKGWSIITTTKMTKKLWLMRLKNLNLIIG